jgi:hypothetical protein
LFVGDEIDASMDDDRAKVSATVYTVSLAKSHKSSTSPISPGSMQIGA